MKASVDSSTVAALISSQKPPIVMADLPVNSAFGFSTTRQGGYSTGSFMGWNMGDHVGDSTNAVRKNRALLKTCFRQPTTLRWLKQVHGARVVAAHAVSDGVEADAAWTDQADIACVVMTADCLPVLLASQAGPWVAAAHGGWRGLVAGVLETTLATCPYSSQSLSAWLGPAIGPTVFEVGEDVRTAFTARYDTDICTYFQPSRTDHWLADLYGIARYILQLNGVVFVGGGKECTYTDSTRFFSYRRDGQTGRMASAIALPPALR